MPMVVDLPARWGRAARRNPLLDGEIDAFKGFDAPLIGLFQAADFQCVHCNPCDGTSHLETEKAAKAACRQKMALCHLARDIPEPCLLLRYYLADELQIAVLLA